MGWRLAVLAAVVWQCAALDLKPLVRLQPSPEEYRPVVRWLRQNTPSHAVVLAAISESPVLFAHTGRPIILHPKFENHEIRERYREFLHAMYGSEEALHEFARLYGADYFVYDTGFLVTGADSRRYKADKLAPLGGDCVAVLFHERPETLRHFHQELMTDRFIVFSVRE
jgi:hypothetical protein